MQAHWDLTRTHSSNINAAQPDASPAAEQAAKAQTAAQHTGRLRPDCIQLSRVDDAMARLGSVPEQPNSEDSKSHAACQPMPATLCSQGVNQHDSTADTNAATLQSDADSNSMSLSAPSAALLPHPAIHQDPNSTPSAWLPSSALPSSASLVPPAPFVACLVMSTFRQSVPGRLISNFSTTACNNVQSNVELLLNDSAPSATIDSHTQPGAVQSTETKRRICSTPDMIMPTDSASENSSDPLSRVHDPVTVQLPHSPTSVYRSSGFKCGANVRQSFANAAAGQSTVTSDMPEGEAGQAQLSTNVPLYAASSVVKQAAGSAKQVLVNRLRAPGPFPASQPAQLPSLSRLTSNRHQSAQRVQGLQQERQCQSEPATPDRLPEPGQSQTQAGEAEGSRGGDSSPRIQSSQPFFCLSHQQIQAEQISRASQANIAMHHGNLAGNIRQQDATQGVHTQHHQQEQKPSRKTRTAGKGSQIVHHCTPELRPTGQQQPQDLSKGLQALWNSMAHTPLAVPSTASPLHISPTASSLATSPHSEPHQARQHAAPLVSHTILPSTIPLRGSCAEDVPAAFGPDFHKPNTMLHNDAHSSHGVHQSAATSAAVPSTAQAAGTHWAKSQTDAPTATACDSQDALEQVVR